MDTFGQRLRALREENNLTQRQLAEQIGYGKSSVSFWENDLKDPTSKVIIKLSKLFKVTSDYLLGLEDYFAQKKQGDFPCFFSWSVRTIAQL